MGTTNVSVAPDNPNSTHDISLFDGNEKWGLRLKGGAKGVQEVPSVPSTIRASQGGGKFGDWEPGFSHIEQRDWSGGRGQEDFAEDASKFYDSKECWTLTPGFIMPAPNWYVVGAGVSMELGGLSYAELEST